MVLAFLVGRPNLNLIAGFPWLLCFLIGVVCAIFLDWLLHLVGGSLPFVTWVLSGAHRGMTMVAMEDELRESAEAYNKLKKAGVLVVRGLNLNQVP